MRTTPTVKQSLIPVVLRRKYGIKKGTPIDISEEKGRLILQPITREFVNGLRGRFKRSKLVEALEAERARDKEREDAKFARFR